MPADSMCEYNWLHTLSKLAVVNEDDEDDEDDEGDEDDEDNEDDEEDADADERVSSCCCNKEGCEGNRGRCVS